MQADVIPMKHAGCMGESGAIGLLRQVRAGYPKRPTLFPQTVILCGVRDLMEYRIRSDPEKAVITKMLRKSLEDTLTAGRV
jgi:hypothetical protein